MHEIDILANAGLSRTTAELVVACYTMAAALASINAQQQQAPPPEAVSGEVLDPEGDDHAD